MSGLSIVSPVVFGESGAAMIGSGTLNRFGSTDGAVMMSGMRLRVGVRARRSAYFARKLASEPGPVSSVWAWASNLTDSGDATSVSGTVSVRSVRSLSVSNRPFTASKLWATRCVGVQRLIPVGFVRMELAVCELERDSEPARDEVRSRSRCW